MYTREKPPQRFTLDRKKVLPFIDKDPFTFVPTGGFLEDVQNYALGFETTNSFSFWTGVHFLSSILKRDIWMPWGTERHYPNFYLILLAHPGLVKKSTTMRVMTPIYDTALDLISNPALVWRKKQELVVSSTATANGMFKLLAEVSNQTNNEFEDINGNRLELFSDSNLILRVSELTTLLSKAQYNANLVDKLTDFFDCKDKDSSTTVAHGHIDLENVFCTMLGATTPSSFQTSMTQEAYGGGFMSRCIVIKESTGYRQYPLPATFKGVPNQEEMANRMAFIAEHAVGEYRLSSGAYDLYAHWYIKFKKHLQAEDPDEILHQDNRRDVNVLKLALIIAAQNYEPRRKILEEDISTSIKVIDYTLNRASKDVMRAAMNPDNLMSQKLLGVIQKYGTEGITKSKLLQNHSKLFTSRILNEHLENLATAECIEVLNLSSGKPKINFTGKHEIYRFKRDL